MRARVLAAASLVALTGCGGQTVEPSSPPAAASRAAPDAAKAQREAARKLLAKLEAEGGCSCTAAIRARDRIERGLATKRPDGDILSG